MDRADKARPEEGAGARPSPPIPAAARNQLLSLLVQLHEHMITNHPIRNGRAPLRPKSGLLSGGNESNEP